MPAYPDSLNRLIQSLKQLPGIGTKTAERLAFHLIKLSKDDALALAKNIADVKQKLINCHICFNFAEKDPCPICSDPQRDKGIVCVVEQAKDLMAFEKAGEYKGVYHCLLGHIALLEGIGPEDLTIEPLVKRVAKGGIKEVIIATSPDLEGEGTAAFLLDALVAAANKHGTRITRIARGVPAGAEIENVSQAILADALSGRREFGGGRDER